jgi:hypothetical protein
MFSHAWHRQIHAQKQSQSRDSNDDLPEFSAIAAMKRHQSRFEG